MSGVTATATNARTNMETMNYKRCPQFDPEYYYGWATEVQAAFAERNWVQYLDPTQETETKTITPEGTIKAFGFLYAGIPLKYKMKITECTTAAEIWTALKQEFTIRNRDDELRLEEAIISIRKTGEEDLNTYITRFETTVSQAMNALPQNQRWDAAKINKYFINSLEKSNIVDEDWKGFSNRVQYNYTTFTFHNMLAEARTWYNSYILPNKEQKKQDYLGAQARAITYNPNVRDNNGNTQSRQNYPKDPNAYCTHHKVKGHSTEQCVALGNAKPTKNKGKNANANSNVRFTGTCHTCSKEGHKSIECWHNPQSKNYRPNLVRTSTDNKEDNVANNSSPRPAAPSSTSRMIRVSRTSTSTNVNGMAHSESWYFDSCCMQNLCSRHDVFHTYDDFAFPLEITGVGDGKLLAYGYGSVAIQSMNAYGTASNIHFIRNVWYVPELNGENFIAMSQLSLSGLTLSINNNDKHNFVLQSNADPNFQLVTSNDTGMCRIVNIYPVPYDPNSASSSLASIRAISTHGINANTIESQLWHERLGHASSKRLKLLGIDWKSGSCRSCIMGKQSRTPFKKNPERSRTKLYRVYADLCGPITPASIGGNKYVFVLVDEATRFCWAYLLSDKESFTITDALKRWIPLVENQAGTKIKFLFTDRGKEFLGDTTAYLESLGITHESTAPGSSESNGVAERMNRTLFDIVRPLLITSGLPASFWGEALDTAVKIRNRLPTKSLSEKDNPSLSPYEAWFGHKPNVDKLKQFGCIAYAKDINVPRGNKPDSRSIECCFIGYDHVERLNYRLWNPETSSVIISRNVILLPNQFLPIERFKIQNRDLILNIPDPVSVEDPIAIGGTSTGTVYAPINIPRLAYRPPVSSSTTIDAPRPPVQYPIPQPNINVDQVEDTDSDSDDDLTPATPDEQQAPADPPVVIQRPMATPEPAEILQPVAVQQALAIQQPEPAIVQQPPALPTRRSDRDRRGPTRFRDEYSYMIHADGPVHNPIEPRSIEEALMLPDAQKWVDAAKEEIQSLIDHETFEVVPRPVDRKIIGTKWVFKLKDPESSQPRYKARLVAQGYSQIEGIDYDETRASVVQMTTLRTLFAIAAKLKMLIHQFDVVTAFLNGTLDNPIYVELPPLFETTDDYSTDNGVLKLNKALYGLKQAGYEWLRKLRGDLRSIGFTQCEEDENIFISLYKRIIIAVYVDDILLLTFKKSDIDELANQFSRFFQYRDLGPVKKFLSMDIYRPDPHGDIYVSQGTYLRRIIARFGMTNSNPAKSPAETSIQLYKRRTDEEPADAELYRQIIGSCMHAATIARPDIAFITNKLSQYMMDPSKQHMLAAKHLLRYLNGHTDLCIRYKSDTHDSDIIPAIYADASYGMDTDDGKSTTGYLATINGGIVSYYSGKQKLLALSSMEAEYVALMEACRESVFIRKILSSLQPLIPSIPNTISIGFHTDAISVINNIKNNIQSARTKHFKIKASYIRELYESGEIDILHIASEDQPADALTKPLGPAKHKLALELLKLEELPSKTNH